MLTHLFDEFPLRRRKREIAEWLGVVLYKKVHTIFSRFSLKNIFHTSALIKAPFVYSVKVIIYSLWTKVFVHHEI